MNDANHRSAFAHNPPSQMHTHNKHYYIMPQTNNEIYAAITMALYQAQGGFIHDEEPGVITIIPRRTAWITPQQIILSR